MMFTPTPSVVTLAVADSALVVYDPTASGLAATDVQAALDEVALALDSANVVYDPTASGLVATDVQAAIDEVVVDLGTAQGDATQALADAATAQAAVDALEVLLEGSAQVADYIAALADVNAVISMNKAGTGTVTIPPNANVAFPTGSVVHVYNQSADAITLTPGDGVTVRNAGTLAQYQEGSVRKRATNEWVANGFTP